MSVQFSEWLADDAELIARALNVGFFRYSPRMWMVGAYIEPLERLQDSKTRSEIIARVTKEYPRVSLPTGETFYRLRKAPAHPGDFAEYDSAPAERKSHGRLDSDQLPVMYGSQDLQICLHECRIAAEDEVYVATLRPSKNLNLLDLTELLPEEDVTEFESLDLAIHMLFLAGKHSYEISRELAAAARAENFDGIIYPSYFSLLRTGAMPLETVYGLSMRRLSRYAAYEKSKIIPNLALFGRPIAEGTVTVKCLNRVFLNQVDYRIHFGPAAFR